MTEHTQLTLGDLWSPNQPRAADLVDRLTDEYKPYSSRVSVVPVKNGSNVSSVFDSLLVVVSTT